MSRYATDPWSPGLKRLAREIRYLVIHIKNTLRDVMPQSIVRCINIVSALRKQLQLKRKEYREYVRNAVAHRKAHLEERAQYHAEMNPNTTKPSEIKRLSHIETQQRDAIKIRFTLDDFHRGSSTFLFHHDESMTILIISIVT